MSHRRKEEVDEVLDPEKEAYVNRLIIEKPWLNR